jgi:hypothetical protein
MGFPYRYASSEHEFYDFLFVRNFDYNIYRGMAVPQYVLKDGGQDEI